MATRPPNDSRILSHGRGGAGNYAKDDPTVSYPKSEDLVTPTLKCDTYTTGRGGQGNMAKNDHLNPELARAAQDVDSPNPQADSQGPVHYGRGGAANIIDKESQRRSGDGKRTSVEPKREEGAAAMGSGGLVAKGKEMLIKLIKK